MDKAAHSAEELESGQQRAEEIAALLAEAQAECRASVEQVADSHGRQLFNKIGDYLDVAIRALRSYRQEEPGPSPRRTLH